MGKRKSFVEGESNFLVKKVVSWFFDEDKFLGKQAFGIFLEEKFGIY
jgi:hypothetical protein